MFYAHYVLSKRGPLARIWLAAHWDKKLTKAHVFETNLEDSVETIISPQVKMALRTSGHLLLGVVRIYNRKAKYLLADCNEAFVKIKMAFRSGVVDLPEESREAQHNQIYIVEEFPNFDTPLPDITDFDVNRHLTLNQSRIDEITMPEEAPSMNIDDSFSMMVDGGMGDQYTSVFVDDSKGGKDLSFMEGPGEDGILGEGGLFGGEDEPNNFFNDNFQKEPEDIVMEADGAMDGQMMSPARPEEEMAKDEDQLKVVDTDVVSEAPKPEEDIVMEAAFTETDITIAQKQTELDVQQASEELSKSIDQEQAANLDTSLNNTAEEAAVVKQPEATFALEPLNEAEMGNVRQRRKRKLIIDPLIELDGQTMREQLKDVDDIVTTLDMAPPTKRLMLWKEVGGVDKLFSHECRTTEERVNKVFVTNLHNIVPQDLVDITGLQLQQRFGDQSIEQQLDATADVNVESNETVDASREEMRRADQTIQSLKLDESGAVVPLPTALLDNTNNQSMINNDLCMNQYNAVNNDSDNDYDAFSGGPPSVGDSVGAPSPGMPLMDENSILELSNLLPTTSLPTDPLSTTKDDSVAADEVAAEPEPEGTAYADDLEDLRWNTRTQHLINDLDRKFKTESEVSFFRLSDGISRKQAVSKFYSLLVLAKQEAANLSQSEIFGDVYIKKGVKFESVIMN